MFLCGARLLLLAAVVYMITFGGYTDQVPVKLET